MYIFETLFKPIPLPERRQILLLSDVKEILIILFIYLGFNTGTGKKNAFLIHDTSPPQKIIFINHVNNTPWQSCFFVISWPSQCIIHPPPPILIIKMYTIILLSLCPHNISYIAIDWKANTMLFSIPYLDTLLMICIQGRSRSYAAVK